TRRGRRAATASCSTRAEGPTRDERNSGPGADRGAVALLRGRARLAGADATATQPLRRLPRGETAGPADRLPRCSGDALRRLPVGGRGDVSGAAPHGAGRGTPDSARTPPGVEWRRAAQPGSGRCAGRLRRRRSRREGAVPPPSRGLLRFLL